SILVLGPFAGVLTNVVAGIMTPIAQTFRKRDEPQNGRVSVLRRTLFNIGMFAVATASAGGIFILLGGKVGSPDQISNLIPLIAAVAASEIINILILIVVIVLQTGPKPYEIWKRDFQWGVPIGIIGGVIGGGGLALAYHLFDYIGVLVFYLPVLTTGFSFSFYVNNMKGYVNRLEEMNRTLDEINLGLLETLGAVIDAYDVYTYGHSTQVSVYADALSQKLGLPDKERDDLRKAALVHDIGKIGVNDRIISKPGPLTKEESRIIKRHTLIGAEIVSQMNGFQELIPLIRHHHERWDGWGYPDGLKAEQIPLGARILAVADSLEAMCSDRPYRPTMKFSNAITEIQQCSGSQFDPRVVDALSELIKEKDPSFFINSATIVDRALVADHVGSLFKGTRYLKKGMLTTPRRA
ncbi:MAG: HD-GYP domain-containing protein, partial [Chloroflexota bacterium]